MGDLTASKRQPVDRASQALKLRKLQLTYEVLRVEKMKTEVEILESEAQIDRFREKMDGLDKQMAELQSQIAEGEAAAT